MASYWIDVGTSVAGRDTVDFGFAQLPKGSVPDSTSLMFSGCSLERADSSVRVEILGLDCVCW